MELFTFQDCTVWFGWLGGKIEENDTLIDEEQKDKLDQGCEGWNNLMRKIKIYLIPTQRKDF